MGAKRAIRKEWKMEAMISQRGVQEECESGKNRTGKKNMEYCQAMETNRTESKAEKFNLVKCNNLKWKDITIATKL